MQLTGGSRFAMQTKSKIQLLTQLAGSCTPLSAPPMCANMWLIAGLCQKCRSTKTLAAVSLPTRHTHQTLPVAVTMCHFKASCLCSRSLSIYLYVSLLLFQSAVCVGSVWIAEQNCSKLKRRTQQGVNLMRPQLGCCSVICLLCSGSCGYTAPLLFHVDSMTFEAFMPGQCANCARSVEVQTIFGTVYKMKFNCIASRRNNLHS